MANVRLKNYGALAYAGMAADDLVYMADHDASDGERKAVLSDIKKYVLGDKTVGGTSAGDILDNNSAQTATNKTFTSPTIGTSVALPATITIGGTALTPSIAELNFVDGVTSAIQTQLNALAAQIPTPTKRVWPYGIKFTASGANITITAATLLTATGLTGYLVNPQGIEIQLYSVSGGLYTKLSVAATYSIDVTCTTGAGVERVSEIKVSGITNAVDYMISVQFTLVWDPA